MTIISEYINHVWLTIIVVFWVPPLLAGEKQKREVEFVREEGGKYKEDFWAYDEKMWPLSLQYIQLPECTPLYMLD